MFNIFAVKGKIEMEAKQKLQREVKILLILFIIMLVLSGITAFPLETELAFVVKHYGAFPEGFQKWIFNVYTGVKETNDRFPFMAYGSDWLAFAHIVIAVFLLF